MLVTAAVPPLFGLSAMTELTLKDPVTLTGFAEESAMFGADAPAAIELVPVDVMPPEKETVRPSASVTVVPEFGMLSEPKVSSRLFVVLPRSSVPLAL